MKVKKDKIIKEVEEYLVGDYIQAGWEEVKPSKESAKPEIKFNSKDK